MNSGRVLAAGPIGQLQSDLSLPLALSQGAAVSLDAIVLEQDAADGLATLAVDGGSFLVPSGPVRTTQRKRLRVLADDVSLARQRPTQSTIINILPARILTVGATSDHQVTAVLGLGEDGKGARLLSRVTQRSWGQLDLKLGLDVYAQVKGVALVRRESSAVS